MSDDRTSAALLRYRVIAVVVGAVLTVLAFVAVPLKYAADQPQLSDFGWPVHGALLIFYCAAALDLSIRCKWDWRRTILVMLAGTIPIMTFYAERRVTRQVRESLAVG